MKQEKKNTRNLISHIKQGFEPTLDFALQRKSKKPNIDILFINFKKVKKRLKIQYMSLSSDVVTVTIKSW